MKTWICTTMSHFFSPHLGAPRVYAYARKQGHDIRLKDLNQDAYFALLTREYLGPAVERVEYTIDSLFLNRYLREDLGSIVLHSSSKAMRDLLAKGFLLNLPWYRYIRSAGIARKSVFGIIGSRIKADNVIYALLSEKEFVLSEIEKARKTLDEGFMSLDPETFVRSFYTLLCGKALIDVAYFPAQMDFGLGFYGSAFNPCTADILRAVEDERYNFLIPYFRKEVLPSLQAEQPGVVGISVTHTSEFIPGFTLAHLIKSACPEVHVVLGGAVVTEVAHRIAGNPPLWSLFDSLVIGPGEHAFSELIEHVEKKADLSGVPNLIYKENGSIKQSEKLHEFDINEACTPEFVSLRPKSGLPLETSSACYWGRCIFCYYPKHGSASHEGKYEKKRVRAMELVLKDIKELTEKYDPLAIGITDSSLHPKRMEAIAEENLRSGKKTKFTALFRFEKEFKSAVFCRKLAEGGFLGGHAGLESGSQRVNNIINKGVDLRDAELIIKNLNHAGILTHVFAIIGTPGETKEDALMTYRFLKRWHRYLKLDWQIYPLYVWEHGPIAQRADELNLKITPLPPDFLVQATMYSVESGLSQQESMGLTIGLTEKLNRFLHPLNRVMDVQSAAMFLLSQKAKGIPSGRVRNAGLKV